jgi:hypothetical protein
MRHSEQLDQLIPALIAAQTAIEAVGKSATNPHYKSLYMPFDAVMGATKPHLAPNGLALAFSMENADESGADVVTTVFHVSGQWLAISLRMPFEKATAQGSCTALTYGSRRGTAAAFAIVADPDDDGNLLESFPVQHSAKAATGSGERAPTPAPKPAPKPFTNKPACSQCGGEMWDNRTNKKNPKAPDFTCMETSGPCRDKSGKFKFGMWEEKESFDDPPAALQEDPDLDDLPFS